MKLEDKIKPKMSLENKLKTWFTGTAKQIKEAFNSEEFRYYVLTQIGAVALLGFNKEIAEKVFNYTMPADIELGLRALGAYLITDAAVKAFGDDSFYYTAKEGIKDLKQMFKEYTQLKKEK